MLSGNAFFTHPLTQFGKGAVFELADPFAADVEVFANLFEGFGVVGVEAEITAEDFGFAFGQFGQAFVEQPVDRGFVDLLVGSGSGVGHQVAVAGIAVFVNRSVERNRRLAGFLGPANSGGVEVGYFGQFVHARRTSQCL